MTGLLRHAAALAVSALVFAAPGHAAADEGDPAPAEANAPRLPVAYASRPLTLPRLVLDPGAGFELSRVTTTITNLSVGAAFGVTDDLQVSALALPLQLTPRLRYGQGGQPGPRIGADLRYASQGTEGALHLDATILSLPATTGVILRPGLAWRFHPGTTGRIDLGAYLPATIGQTATVGLDVPFSFTIDLGRTFHAGLSTGFSFATWQAPVDITIPFGLLAGITVVGKDGPVLDVDPFWRWPVLLQMQPTSPGRDPGAEFELGLNARVYLYL